MEPTQVYSVSDFQAVCNQILDNAFTGVVIEGEVASFKVNQGKFVFFDLKDDQSSIGCFMMKFALRFPLEDGMKIRVRATPKLTNWGKFSLTVQAIMPVGEGSLKKSFELLKKKLTDEGLFAPEKKRPLPENITKIGVISSTQAAGYADFCKILNERWGGLEVQVAHCQVQGMVAADQIIKALAYFNEHSEVQVIAVIRGGGSADDLAVFNDEALVVVASTPSNAAQMLTRDRREIIESIHGDVKRINNLFNTKVDEVIAANREQMLRLSKDIVVRITTIDNEVKAQCKILEQLNPEKVLERGYALMKGDISLGNVVEITTHKQAIKAKITEVKER